MQLKQFINRLFRSTDPVTSKMAAAQAEPMLARHERVILEALKLSPNGKTGIARLSGLDENQVSRRLKIMQQRGLIDLTGKVVKSSTNRAEREWRAV
jgi:DNA-binding MarR family transcriptional regulator